MVITLDATTHCCLRLPSWCASVCPHFRSCVGTDAHAHFHTRKFAGTSKTTRSPNNPAWNKGPTTFGQCRCRRAMCTCFRRFLCTQTKSHSLNCNHITAFAFAVALPRTFGFGLGDLLAHSSGKPRCVIAVPCTRLPRATTGSTPAELELGRSRQSSIAMHSTCSQP